jgi:hypothetical protein
VGCSDVQVTASAAILPLPRRRLRLSVLESWRPLWDDPNQAKMLTFFTTAKPFLGQSDIIQRNALKSWTLVHPDVEIILFGDDQGSTEVARELRIRHEPNVEKNELGTNRVDYMFSRAQQIARHDLLCYSNCDIIFLPDFRDALERVKEKYARFLALGRRWDTDVDQPIDFSMANWAAQMLSRAVGENRQRPPWFIDYFVFARGVFGSDLPPLLIGRVNWDNWMVWKGIESGNPVIDMSRSVVAVHQNHDYLHHPKGKAGVYGGPEAYRNFQLAGGWKHMRTIADASLALSHDGFKNNWRRYGSAIRRDVTRSWHFALSRVWHPIWFGVLGVTRPLRSALGLRRR